MPAAASAPCCSVCAERPARAAACPQCGYPACAQCVRRWLLTRPDAECMACRAAWPLDVLDSVAGRSFADGAWRRHRGAELLRRETALLRATEERLPAYREMCALVESTRKKIRRLRALHARRTAKAVAAAGEALHDLLHDTATSPA